ncbi:MAG: hypothetical protein M5R36_07210 [Deltaproteobacteria bacterium]|nr:hypothetical protein [Deltaproteobacteria bacterium]
MGRIDHAQYVESWSSGFGLDELIEKLDEMAREERVDIFVAPFWGMPTAALYLALEDHPRAHIHMAPWFRDKPLLAEAKATGSLTSFPNPYDERDTRLVPYAELRRCVFVANVPQMKLGDFMRRNPDATLVEAFYRPGRKSSLAILDVPK